MSKDWYKDAVIYQVHIKSFKDSNGDGIGDFKGLTSQLDYLESLGINALWVLPFYPSPLRDDGYDIQEYTKVNPDYGNIQDFKKFLKEAHQRGIRVITELVLNHTSDQHPWFQRARKSPAGSNYRNYYVWNDSPDKYQEARIIFKDFEHSNWSWDPVAKSYYWHRFYSHQPDLNFENTHVQEALFKVLDFWFKMGVDGMRLDAVPYLFEEEGTNCENLPKTYEYLKKLRKYIDSRYKDKMLLAEANQWPEDAVEYFGDDDACHMAFHFPLMPRMFMALKMEDRFPIIDILEQTPKIPENCQWALFLRNHDELTLEMVTDEERDYMYAVYAKDKHARINMGIRRRLAPLLENNRRKIELLNFLLFCLPGTPIIYYGDEIGMGDNYYLGDRDGVRTPMQWNENKNAGFSNANPQRLFLPVIIDPEYNYETINVDTQEKNSSSLLWWMRKLINLRKQYKAFGRGEISFLQPDNQAIVAFISKYEGEQLLVLVNLSRYTQPVELNLEAYEGYSLVEIFSGNQFPTIKHYPYLFTMSAYDYNCFLLKENNDLKTEKSIKIPVIKINNNDLKKPANNRFIRSLEKVMFSFLIKQRWFGSKGGNLQKLVIIDIFSYECESYKSFTAFVQLEFSGKNIEIYQVPLIIVSADDILFSGMKDNVKIAAELKHENNRIYYLIDALELSAFRNWLYKSLKGKLKIKSGKASVIKHMPDKKLPLITDYSNSKVLKADQSNSVIIYNDELFIKLYRRIESGIQPELEILRYLRKNEFKVNTPQYLGHFEYVNSTSKEIFNLAVCEDFVENESDGWSYTLDILKSFLEKSMVIAESNDCKKDVENLYYDSLQNFDESFTDILNPLFIATVGKLARSLAYLHISLGSDNSGEEFSKEKYSQLYQRSLFQGIQANVRKTCLLFEKNKKNIGELSGLGKVIKKEKSFQQFLKFIIKEKISGARIRCHGDFHLGQLLFTGNEFIVLDFEGEPCKPISERRRKTSPLKDVAGIMRSFHYAGYSALFNHYFSGKFDILEPWIKVWTAYHNAHFFKEYTVAMHGSGILPDNGKMVEKVLNAYLIDKAFYELSYEINNRPDFIKIPLKGLESVLNIL